MAERIMRFIERVRYGAREDPMFGGWGPFLGIKFSVRPPEETVKQEDPDASDMTRTQKSNSPAETSS